jgi:hypothetical protein
VRTPPVEAVLWLDVVGIAPMLKINRAGSRGPWEGFSLVFPMAAMAWRIDVAFGQSRCSDFCSCRGLYGLESRLPNPAQ